MNLFHLTRLRVDILIYAWQHEQEMKTKHSKKNFDDGYLQILRIVNVRMPVKTRSGLQTIRQLIGWMIPHYKLDDSSWCSNTSETLLIRMSNAIKGVNFSSHNQFLEQATFLLRAIVCTGHKATSETIIVSTWFLFLVPILSGVPYEKSEKWRFWEVS